MSIIYDIQAEFRKRYPMLEALDKGIIEEICGNPIEEAATSFVVPTIHSHKEFVGVIQDYYYHIQNEIGVLDGGIERDLVDAEALEVFHGASLFPYSIKKYKQAKNGDLAGVLGDFLKQIKNRVTSHFWSYCTSTVIEPDDYDGMLVLMHYLLLRYADVLPLSLQEFEEKELAPMWNSVLKAGVENRQTINDSLIRHGA